MLQFVQSIWLWASAGIIVPVVIHLWNVKEGKTLQVGSIAFLAESAKSHAKSLRLSDLLLLLLRCLLIIVLAMLIAKPFYEKQVDLHKEKGWVLIEKSQVDEAYKKFKPSIDSLIHAGFAFHYFNAGFKEGKFDTVVKSVRDTGMDENISYWNLLKQLDQKIPSTLPVYLFTDNSLRRFTGARPDVSLSLRWYVYASSDTSSTWVQNAYQISTDSIRVISGNSTPTITRFQRQTISSKDAAHQFSFKNTDGKTFVSYNDTSKTVCNNPVKIDTSTTVISIYQHGYDLDANYLNAALNAIKAFTKYRFRVSVVSDIRQIAHHCNWLFWLSEEKVPESLFKNNVFLYEKGKLESRHSSLITEDKSEATITENIPLYRTVAGNHSEANTFPVWKDGFGKAVLTIEKQNANIYHFYSRFNPEWNGLPWSTQFPQIILRLIFNKSSSSTIINNWDKRIIDAAQVQPVITSEQNIYAKRDLLEKKELSKTFWIIAFVLFFLERIIASKAKKEEGYV